MTNTTNTTKTCSMCNESRLLNEYSRDRRASDGHQHRCKACSKADQQARRAANPEYLRNYYQENKARIHRQRAIRFKERYANDVDFRIRVNLSSGMRALLSGRQLTKGGKSCMDILGYTVEEYREHIESQFTGNMSWENHGDTWQVDHIIPRAAWNITSVECEALKKCNQLANLRPISKARNIQKNDALIPALITSHDIEVSPEWLTDEARAKLFPGYTN